MIKWKVCYVVLFRGVLNVNCILVDEVWDVKIMTWCDTSNQYMVLDIVFTVVVFVKKSVLGGGV